MLTGLTRPPRAFEGPLPVQQPKPQSQPRVIPIQAFADPEAKVYPRSVKGRFTTWRWVFVWLTQAVFYGLCWIPWDGRQAILFDIDARKFYLFDLVLWPQDTIYLVALLVLCALALFVFTAVAGRLWCGYACPQTVYTEIFLAIEKWIEGDRSARIKLDAAPWSAKKALVKGAKHGAWGLFALWTGITFVGYFVPIRELVAELANFSAGHWSAFWVLFYGFATYGNAGFLREQMCRQICPYARFQFVMLDPDSLIIAYDTARGEPRGGRARAADRKAMALGDCVDCGICVQVCPTGIDIRNGLQNECIGCAACIDACDQVMGKLDYPRGLIRYSTENAVALRMGPADILRRALRPRVLAYAAIFAAILGSVAWSLATRIPLRVDVIRDRGVLAREAEDGAIENVYRLQVMNISERARSFRIEVEGLPGIHLADKAKVMAPGGAASSLTASVRATPEGGRRGSVPIVFRITAEDDPKVAVSEAAKFWLP
ncbi:MAG: cytochrome c oxidase accessory protein CcoG [Rhodocyclaceae bacterium]|nr:cytochrome c oxidase accessory protein CcoG [Rhodocyclaceae bacterium]